MARSYYDSGHLGTEIDAATEIGLQIAALLTDANKGKSLAISQQKKVEAVTSQEGAAYTAGNGISISADNVISLNIADGDTESY